MGSTLAACVLLQRTVLQQLWWKTQNGWCFLIDFFALAFPAYNSILEGEYTSLAQGVVRIIEPLAALRTIGGALNVPDKPHSALHDNKNVMFLPQWCTYHAYFLFSWEFRFRRELKWTWKIWHRKRLITSQSPLYGPTVRNSESENTSSPVSVSFECCLKFLDSFTTDDVFKFMLPVPRISIWIDYLTNFILLITPKS